MDTFYITGNALPRLCLITLLLALCVYFAGLSKKAPGTWWLVGSLGAFLLHNVAFFELYTLHTSWSEIMALKLTLNTALAGSWAFFALAYRFLGNPYPRESRLMLGMTGVLVTAMMAIISVRGTGINPIPVRLHTVIATTMILLITVGTIFIYARRAAGRTRSGKEIPDPREPNRRAYLALSILMTFTLILDLVVLLLALGVLPNTLAQQLQLILWAIILIGFITIYANFVPEQTSFQVKVVGFAFASIITVLGIASIFAFRELPSIPGTPVRPLRLDPVWEGGYRISNDNSLMEPVQGLALPIRDDMEVRIPIGFAFPFADTTWRDLIVDDDAFVSFGSRPMVSKSSLYYGTTTPWIALLMTDLAPTGREVYLVRTPDRLTVTWKDVQLYGQVMRVTTQLVLEADGSIVFRYGEGLDGIPFFRGYSPSSTDPKDRRALVSGEFVEPDVALVEDRRPAWYAAEHKRSMPFAFLILGAGVALLLVFPFYLHESITRPLKRLLEGVRRTTEGNLDIDVDIGAQDEIGILTDNFNRMTNALRVSEAALRTYADELEKRVSERTAELDEKNVSLEVTLHTLQRTQAQLVQQEKLASMGQLTAGIAHEIKNPLNFINNFAELNSELADELKEEISANPDIPPTNIVEVLDAIKVNAVHIAKNGQRADGIVNSMMEHAREGGGQRLHVGLNPFVEENISLSYNSMKAQHPDLDVEIERDLDEPIRNIEMSPQEMGRALINVLNNAFDAVIRKRQSAGESYEPQVRVETRQLDNTVEIHITDNGPGIPADIKEKIFEPFFTTKPTGSGTGLGLSLAYDIVTQGHGGMMTVDSEEGEGATFVITLPA